MEVISGLLIAIALILFASLYKKDVTLLMFSGILIFLMGLNIVQSGTEVLNNPQYIGLVFVTMGFYIMIRIGIDLIFQKKDG